MIDDPMGEVLREEGRVGLRYRRALRHPPEKVWRALTESQHLRHWMPADLVGERRAGASLELPFWPPFVAKYGIDVPTLTGTIRVWEPPRIFEYTWDTDVLRFELEATPEGTTLTFTTWLVASQAGEKTAAGYHACLACLAELLDRGAVEMPLVTADVGPMEARYAALFVAAT